MKEKQVLITRKISKVGFGPQIYNIYLQLYDDKPKKTDYTRYTVHNSISAFSKPNPMWKFLILQG